MFKETRIPKAWLDLVDCLEKNQTRTAERQHVVKGTCKEYQESCGKKSFSPKVSGIIMYIYIDILLYINKCRRFDEKL